MSTVSGHDTQELVSNPTPLILTPLEQITKLQQEMGCVICLEHLCLPVQLSTSHVINNGKKIKCTHKFCLICIRKCFGMNERYKDYSKFKCPMCRAQAPQRDPYFHQESDHVLLDILQNGAKRPCPNECGFEWGSQSTIRSHLLNDCANGFSSCKVCRTTMKRSDLILHEANHERDMKIAQENSDRREMRRIQREERNRLYSDPGYILVRQKHLRQIVSAANRTHNVSMWKKFTAK
jgi:hypothetical protein